jgi:lysophospholipase L1-like esterase
MLTADTSTVAVPLPAEAENDLQSQIADKISQATLDAHTTNSVDAHGIDTKAEQVDLIAHENNSTDAHGINNKTDQVDFAEHTGDIHAHNLDSKADVTYVNDQLSEKADVTYVNDQLSEKADVTYVDNLTAEDIDAMDLGRFYSTTTVEGILNEIGQELKEVSFTTHTQTESIKSLPTGSIDENVSNFEAEGLSLVNSVKNGDFSDGTTGWASNHGSLVISNKVASHTGSGSSAGPYLGNFPKMTIKEGDKVYLFTKNRVTNANCNSISFSFRGSTGGSTTSAISIISPVQNKWYEMQRVLTIPPNYSGKLELYIYHFYADATTANGKVMEVDGNAGVHAINMTALGIEDYTEEQMLDLVRSGYIDGLENVESPKVESVGKNLFDVLSDITTYGTIIDRGIDSFTFVPDILTRNGFFRVQVKRNTDYRLSWNAIEDTVGNGVMAIFSDDVVPIVGYTTSKNFQLNSGENDVIRVYFRNHIAIEPITFKDIQLEEGSTATAYEPYKSSQLTANVPLRSLPNGVKDRIYEADGQMWLEKNVEEISLLSGQVINTTNIPLASTASSYIAHQTDGTTLTGVVDGTDTLTADATIHYELETPELINLTEQGLTSGELMSFENGTVYNSSDTFHSPNLSFDVVTDRNVQLDAKVDQTEFDAHKAEMAKLTINLDSLSGWFAKVASVNTSPLKLMIVGDSISEGWSATNFQNYGYVGVLRDKITALMSPSLKPGMFYPVARYYKSGSRVFSVIDKNSVTLNMTARLVNDLVEDSTYARLVSGDILSFDSQDEYSYISESHDALEIIYKRKPDGGRFTISNGTYSETIDTNGTTALIKHQIPNVGSTAYHVWTITAIDDGLTVDIYGLTTFLSGNISRGGIIYNTSRYGTTAGFNSILASAIAPDLTIITHGSNDFESQVDPDAYYDKIVTSGNYAEASGSSVLLASIGTRSFGSKALCQEVYVQKMQDAAHNNGWGFINLHKMWGGYAGAKAESYLAADDTHPLNTGHTSIGNIIWSYIKEL